MAKFNQPGSRAVVSSPIRSTADPTATTYEGAPGFTREPKGELFLLAVSNMVGEDTYYESAGDRDDRFRRLVRQVATADGGWTLEFLRWLRSEGNMRSAPLVAAAEAVHARLAEEEGDRTANRSLIDAVLQRADEPGEMLAYWISRFGRNVPKPVKRGVADAVARLYDERALLKYDADSRGLRFADVLELVHVTATHPQIKGTWRGDLFEHAIDRRHDLDNPIPESLGVLRRRAELMALPVGDRRAALNPDTLRAAGMTWEALAGWLQGPMDAAAWSAVIPSMGIFSLTRNLRNFDEAGVPDDVAATVAALLSDPDVIARSRMLPMRFLAAYRAAPSLRWGHALEQALGHSLANVPTLAGRTLILVDRSGSMRDTMSDRSDLTRGDAAAIFGTALALRAEHADLVQFGTTSSKIELGLGQSLLRAIDKFGWLGGTATADAVRRWYRDGFHSRVVIVTDEQA
ncbi:MAG TPA: TROVE domain-containing protein, partial [Mycobacteriales bacterium]|nr:TROVE domain-containing protein [Mycobacteriales bacterium]